MARVYGCQIFGIDIVCHSSNIYAYWKLWVCLLLAMARVYKLRIHGIVIFCHSNNIDADWKVYVCLLLALRFAENQQIFGISVFRCRFEFSGVDLSSVTVTSLPIPLTVAGGPAGRPFFLQSLASRRAGELGRTKKLLVYTLLLWHMFSVNFKY